MAEKWVLGSVWVELYFAPPDVSQVIQNWVIQGFDLLRQVEALNHGYGLLPYQRVVFKVLSGKYEYGICQIYREELFHLLPWVRWQFHRHHPLLLQCLHTSLKVYQP